MFCFFLFFFQAEDGIRDLVRSRGLGDVYKRQLNRFFLIVGRIPQVNALFMPPCHFHGIRSAGTRPCLLYTSDAADERSSVDLGGRRIIKKNTINNNTDTSSKQ